MSSNKSVDLLVFDNLVLDNADQKASCEFCLKVKRGSVHVLFGDDQEFLSRIIRTIAGFERPVGGEFRFNGRCYSAITPRKATHLGIEIIDRLNKGFLNLSVFDNIYAERWNGKSRFLHGKKNRLPMLKSFFLTSIFPFPCSSH
jgi:ABC-type sugar transport system ATPase subunit